MVEASTFSKPAMTAPEKIFTKTSVVSQNTRFLYKKVTVACNGLIMAFCTAPNL